jgi:hypothetical protein
MSLHTSFVIAPKWKQPNVHQQVNVGKLIISIQRNTTLQCTTDTRINMDESFNYQGTQTKTQYILFDSN